MVGIVSPYSLGETQSSNHITGIGKVMLRSLYGGVRFVIRLPLVIIQVGFSLTETNQLLGYPHDYGSPQPG